MTDIDREIMDAYTVIFDGLEYLGPGDHQITRQLIGQLDAKMGNGIRAADFGCGTGASTLVLAECLPQARILALDMNEPFIAQLNAAAQSRGLDERICAMTGDMGDPPALDGVTGEFDLIWSESAIYSIGRSNALASWHPLLKPGGWLVFSEIVWVKGPAQGSGDVVAFWEQEYPGITSADTILDELQAADYLPLAPVYTGARVWSNYYEPLRKRLHVLTQQSGQSQALMNIMADIEKEIEIYDRTAEEVAVVFFIAKSKQSEPGIL